jgi:cell division protein FtsQ
VALLSLDQLHLVADDGLVFKALGPGDPFDLPVITGLDPDQVQKDKRSAAASVVGAVALLRDYEDAGMIRKYPLSEIHVEADGSLSLYVGGDPTYVRLGKAPFRTKLTRLREVFAQLGREKTSAAYVYLDSEKRPDRVTVKLR